LFKNIDFQECHKPGCVTHFIVFDMNETNLNIYYLILLNAPLLKKMETELISPITNIVDLTVKDNNPRIAQNIDLTEVSHIDVVVIDVDNTQPSIDMAIKEEYNKKLKIAQRKQRNKQMQKVKRLRAQDLYFSEEQTLLNKEYHEKRRRLWRPIKAFYHFRAFVNNYFDFLQKKMRKDLIQKLKRLSNVPKTGISVNGRNGSTRNGFVVSVSRYHRPVLTAQEIIHRNTLLQVHSDVCFWCKTQPATVLDHAHPCCSMKRSEFSWTNKLNIFPSCTQCNQTKGGNAVLDWLTMDIVVSNWSSEQINTFQNWLSLNGPKLLFGSEYTALTVQQFSTINKFHQVMELCAKHKKDAGYFLGNTLDHALVALNPKNMN
jgi:hypothetical protein